MTNLLLAIMVLTGTIATAFFLLRGFDHVQRNWPAFLVRTLADAAGLIASLVQAGFALTLLLERLFRSGVWP